MTTVIILAGGTQSRWTGAFQKQLCDINGTPLIRDTIKKCTKYIYEDDINILAWHPEIKDVVPNAFMPDKHSCVCESLFETRNLWKGKVLVMHGDVIFSYETLRKMFNSDGLLFFGNTHEIFGYTFMESDYDKMRRSLEIVSIQYELGNGRGKLWELYRTNAGLPLEEHEWGKHSTYVHIDDYTQDFDLLSQYYDFIGLVKNTQIDLSK